MRENFGLKCQKNDSSSEIIKVESTGRGEESQREREKMKERKKKEEERN